jgi:hypothetical protein
MLIIITENFPKKPLESSQQNMTKLMQHPYPHIASNLLIRSPLACMDACRDHLFNEISYQ